jgi:hypothetical protein
MIRKLLLSFILITLLSTVFAPGSAVQATSPESSGKPLQGLIAYLAKESLYIWSSDFEKPALVLVDSKTVITLNGQKIQLSQLLVGDAVIISFQSTYNRTFAPMAETIVATRAVFSRAH